MPIKSSGYYNDPALAQAASNLAGLFEPPSGSDAYGWAQAKKTRQETQALAEYYRLATTPGSDPALMENVGIGADLFDPSQSFTTERMKDATERYKQEVASREARAGAVDVANVNRASNVDTSLLTAVPMGGTRYVPPAIATERGVDAIQPGAMTAGANEIIKVPGTDVTIEGPTTPLTMDQAEAAAFQDLPPQSQQDLAMSKYELVDVIDEQGNKKVMTRGEADRRGLAPLEKPMTMDEVTAATFAEQLELTENDPVARQALLDKIMARGQTAEGKATNGQWVKPDGTVEVVSQKAGESIWRTQDNQPVPRGARITNLETPSATDAKNAQTAQAIINGKRVPVTMKAGESVWKTADGMPIPPDAQVTNLETPAAAPGPTDVANGQAILRGGGTVPVYQNTGEGIWRTQDGQPIDMKRVTSVTQLPSPQGATADIVPKTVEGDVQKKLIDLGGTMKTAITLREMIAKSPASAGLVGRLRGFTQDAIATGDELGQFFGGGLAQVEQDIKANVIDPVLAKQLFDPKIKAIEVFGNLLAYQYAKTLSEDRVSNESLKIARNLLGVDGLLANQQSITAVLDSTLKGFAAQQGYLKDILAGGIDKAIVPVPESPTANAIEPAATAPAATAPAAGKKRRRFDAQGNEIP